MSNKNKDKTKATKKPTVTTPTLPAIKDNKTSSNQGIILVNQKTMQDIYKKSGTLAKVNEFQTHYWAVNYRYKAPDDSILDICVPTVYFNYKQEVSSAHIDFDLKDVKEYSAALEPVHNMMVHKINEYDLHGKLESILGVTLESSPSPFNSIHRHPGTSKSQSFSGTDLAKTAAEPGVVYPLAKAEEAPNFAGIMALDSGTCNVAHYEYRVATGELGKDIAYTKGRCVAIVADKDTSVSAVEQLMGIEPTNKSYLKLNGCQVTPLINVLTELAIDFYGDFGFEAFTKAVTDEHLEAKITTGRYNYGGYGKYDPDAELKAYRHRFMTPSELDKKTVAELNKLYKGITYEETGTKIYTWLGTKDLATKTITALQNKYGYTEKNIYGTSGYKFLTETQLKNLNIFEIRDILKEALLYFEPNAKVSKLTTATRNDVLDDLYALEMKYSKVAKKQDKKKSTPIAVAQELATEQSEEAIIINAYSDTDNLLDEDWHEYLN